MTSPLCHMSSDCSFKIRIAMTTLRRPSQEGLLPTWKGHRVHEVTHEGIHRLPPIPKDVLGVNKCCRLRVQFGGVTIMISPCSYKYLLISPKYL